jgi:polygalacturonase
MLRDCSDISVRGCQVINPEFRGVEVVNCSNLKISDCLVNEQESFTRMLAGIEITGSCPGTIIKNNSIGRGKKGDILNRSSGAVISDNITVGKSR